MKAFLTSVALWLTSTACVVPQLAVTPRYGEFEIDGDFAAVESGSAVRSDLDTMGLDDAESSFVPRVDLSWIGQHLSISAMGADFSGSGMVEGDIVIDGMTITGGTPVNSSFDFQAYSGVWTWDIAPTDMFELGIGLGVTLVDVDIEIVDTGGGTTLTTDDSLPVPVVAARVGFDLGPFDILGTAGFLDYSASEGDVQIIDLDLAGEYRIFGGSDHASGRIALGYRSFDVEAEYEDGDSEVVANFTVEGPYIGVTFSF